MATIQTCEYVRYEDADGEWHTALFETEAALEAFADAYDGYVERHDPLSVRYSYDSERVRAAAQEAQR